MVRNRYSQVVFALVVLAALLAVSVPAFAGATSSAQWNFTVGPVTCTFAGIHSAAGGQAYGRTNDANDRCSRLKVRLKYKRASDGATVTTAWVTSPATASAITRWAGVSSTAIASQHQAQNPWNDAWSTVREPHAF